jgi:ferredoxin
MEIIANSKSADVTLEIGRVQQSTVINYSNGICISAKPGESYGFLAQKSGIHVEYECRTGNCLTCQQWMEFPEKMNSSRFEEGNLYQRTILNCVGSVPRGYVWLRMLVGGADISD